MKAVLLGLFVGAVIGLLGPVIAAIVNPQAEAAYSFMPLFTVPAGSVAGIFIGWIVAVFRNN